MTAFATTPERAQRADARRNRQRVVTAARDCMACDGLDAAMEDIARRAGVGVGTVYRHFPNKDELVDALVYERFERLRDVALEALEQDDPVKGFDDFMRECAQIQLDDRALSEILVSRPDAMMRAAESVDMLELTTQVLERAQKAGAVRKDADPRDVPMVLCALAGTFKTPFADPERYLAIVLDGLRPAPKQSKLPPR